MLSVPTNSIGGVVLCGGRSSRMGRPKLALPFGPELMLPRVVRILSDIVSPIIVVAAADQELPDLPEGVRIARDEQEYQGPLAGIAIGLAALAADVEAAYVSSCDVPLLNPEFVRAVIDKLPGHDIAIPREKTFRHPLAAAYRTHLVATARQLVTAGQLRPVFLLERCRTCEIDVEQLRTVDPELASLQNINTPDDYHVALRSAGFASE